MIMKKLIGTVLASFCLTSLMAQDIVMDGPDGKLQLAVFASSEANPVYSIVYNGEDNAGEISSGNDHQYW